MLLLVEQALECCHPSFHYPCLESLFENSMEGEGGALRRCDYNERLQLLLVLFLPGDGSGPAKGNTETCHVGPKVAMSLQGKSATLAGSTGQ